MSAFADQLLLQFLQKDFVEDLLIDKLGLTSLFKLIYELPVSADGSTADENIELKEIKLADVLRKQFAVPAFETIRTSGIDERTMPTAERVKVDRAQPRYGRLAWIDVFLEVLLATKVESKAMPIERITAQNLLDKLGGVNSMAELKSKLTALYPPSVVEAFFKQLRITSVDDFKSRPALFLKFVHKAPPPFDANNPSNARDFRLNICVQLQSELKIVETLQAAKLCRGILENEHDFVQTLDGVEIDRPYAFVVIFADSAVVESEIPKVTKAEIKTNIKNLFQAERMLAHFA